MAGLIGAKHDGWGVGGINPSAHVVAAQIDRNELYLPDYAEWLGVQLLDIIRDNRVNIVNMSFGYPEPQNPRSSATTEPVPDPLYTLIKQQKHVLFIAAAGNKLDQNGCTTRPACLELDLGNNSNILSVVALSKTGAPLPDMNVHREFSMGAVGDMMLGPSPFNNYAYLGGSSQAAALVSATASLAAALGARWTPVEYKERLTICADLGDPANAEKMIGGILDVECVLNWKRDMLELADERLYGSVQLKRPDADEGTEAEMKYFDLEAAEKDDTNWKQVVALQRLNGDGDRYAIFKSSGAGEEIKLDRIIGNFKDAGSAQIIVFEADNGETRPFAITEVKKFVRRMP